MAGFSIKALKQINNGLGPDDGTGDTLRTGAEIINDNFDVTKTVVNSQAAVDVVEQVGNGVQVNSGSGVSILGGSQTLNANSVAIAAALNYLAISQASGALVSYLTKADMDADLAHDDGVIALVTNDPAPGNNQSWRKSGGSGSGSWEITIDRTAVVLGNGAGFQQLGAGAVLRNFQDKAREIVSLTDFSAVGGDWGPALQAAHDSLPTDGGEILIPAGVFDVHSGVVFTKRVVIKGRHKEGSVLQCHGTNGGVAFIRNTSTQTTFFEKMSFAGDKDTGAYLPGSIGYSVNGNSESLNASFTHWDTISVWSGGYYHKHIGSYFTYFKYGFDGYNANNLAFSCCRVSTFDSFVRCNGGVGPVSFHGGSIEKWTGTIMTGTAGASFSVSLSGVYFENYPDTPVSPPLTSVSGYYDNAVGVVVADRAISVTGCMISLKGIKRLVVATQSTTGSTVHAGGNTLFGTGYAGDFVYYLNGSLTSAMLMDRIGAPLAAGSYTNALPSLGRVILLDQATGSFILPPLKPPTYIAATLTEGWANNGTSGFGAAKYAIGNDGAVSIIGSVNGYPATGNSVMTLPSNMWPTTFKQFSLPTSAGGQVTCRVGPSGAVTIDGSGPYPNGIGLEGIRFYPGT
jgi:hypothetical protein